jgi:hypothetical protein
VDLPKNRMTLAAGVAAAGIVTAARAAAAWPALVRPEPPLEKSGDDGLQIRLVEPPKAATKASSPLDVGLSEAAEAMAKGREALFVRTPPVRQPSPASRPRTAPIQLVQVDDEDDRFAPAEPADDQWRREAERRDRFEQARQRRWEEERLAREAQDERAALREASEHRRWEEARERDRYENRSARPREEDRQPAPEPW